MKLVTCTRCGGSGVTLEPSKRKAGGLYARKCTGCAGVESRAPVARRKSTGSPWGLTPFAVTPSSVEKWDWQGAAKKIEQVNKLRKDRGLPPLKVPKRMKAS